MLMVLCGCSLLDAVECVKRAKYLSKSLGIDTEEARIRVLPHVLVVSGSILIVDQSQICPILCGCV